MDRLEHKMDDLANQVREIREDQIRTALEARLALVETSQHRRTGIFFALEWIYKLGPWMFITIIAVYNFYNPAS